MAYPDERKLIKLLLVRDWLPTLVFWKMPLCIWWYGRCGARRGAQRLVFHESLLALRVSSGDICVYTEKDTVYEENTADDVTRSQ